jgi:hypothetical protein
VFDRLWTIADAGRSSRVGAAEKASARPIPRMSEPWYCCAEPTVRQRDAY